MLRALWLGLVMLVAASPARAAGDIDTCRNSTAEPAARLAACESVIADEKITGPSRVQVVFGTVSFGGFGDNCATTYFC